MCVVMCGNVLVDWTGQWRRSNEYLFAYLLLLTQPIGRFIYLLLNHYMLYLSNFAILFATSAITSSAFYPGVILPFLQMMFLVANGFVVPKYLFSFFLSFIHT